MEAAVPRGWAISRWEAGAVAVGLAGMVGLRFYDAQIHWLLPPCAFHALTGCYCPGCGSTRAIRALTHGDLVAAWHFNPLLVVGIPVLATLWLSERFSVRPLGHSPRFAWGTLIVVFLFWILRNLPWAPFTALAPH